MFADDAAILAEPLEAQVMTLEALLEEAQTLVFWVSWVKTKVYVFGDLIDETVQSFRSCGEDIGISETFTYHNSVSFQEVSRRISLVHGVINESFRTT